MATSETVVFNGIKFRRYPESGRWSDRAYFRPGAADRQRGVQALHQEVWKAANGGAPIPPGYQVHHADGDPSNNAPENLRLVTRAEHDEEHRAERAERGRASIEKARPYAAEWHRSEEGRRWHSEHAKRAYESRKETAHVCEWCDAVFGSLARRESTRFCSNRCRAAARRASGADDVQRQCEACGEEFTINRHKRTRTCSRKCGQALRRRS